MSLEFVDFSLRNAGLGHAVAGVRIGSLHKGDYLSALANKAVNVKDTSESATPVEIYRAFRASIVHLFWFLVWKAFFNFNNKTCNRRATVSIL